MDNLLDFLSSAIGSLTNPAKLANTFGSVKKDKVTRNTVCRYLDCICESFLAERAARYDVKGRKYLETPCKYYFTDKCAAKFQAARTLSHYGEYNLQ